MDNKEKKLIKNANLKLDSTGSSDGCGGYIVETNIQETCDDVEVNLYLLEAITVAFFKNRFAIMEKESGGATNRYYLKSVKKETVNVFLSRLSALLKSVYDERSRADRFDPRPYLFGVGADKPISLDPNEVDNLFKGEEYNG